MRRSPRITATTTCHCWSGITASTDPRLFTLLDTVELEATTADRSGLDAVEFTRANRARTGEYIPETTTIDRDGRRVTLTVDAGFAGLEWQKVSAGEAGPASWSAATWRCAGSPTSPPSCGPETSDGQDPHPPG